MCAFLEPDLSIVWSGDLPAKGQKVHGRRSRHSVSFPFVSYLAAPRLRVAFHSAMAVFTSTPDFGRVLRP